jgi:hypothetical protein
MPPVHEYEVYRAVPTKSDRQSDEGVEKVAEGGFGHFARRHSKFTVRSRPSARSRRAGAARSHRYGGHHHT